MASVSLTTVVNAGLNLLGILDSGGSATSPQLTDALPIVNNLIRNKSADRLMAAAVLTSTGALTPGVQSYSLSNVPEIISAVVKLANGFTMPVEVVNATQWGQIPDRDRQSYFVKKLFFQRGTAGTGLVYLSPIPLGGSLEFYTWAAMNVFADTTTPITVQDSYVRWLEFAAAVEIAPMYASAQVSQALLQDLADATATLRNLNASLFGQAPPSGQISSQTTPPASIPAIAAEGA